MNLKKKNHDNNKETTRKLMYDSSRYYHQKFNVALTRPCYCTSLISVFRCVIYSSTAPTIITFWVCYSVIPPS